MNTITRLRIVTPSEDAYADAMSSTGSKKLTKHMAEEIVGSISGELPSGFPVKVLEMLHNLGETPRRELWSCTWQ